MKLSATLLVSAALSIFALGADLRDVQAELKGQGFYFGEVDGAEGTETTAAIRRFQIRNGLEVTGKLNDETLGALGMAPAATAKADPKTAPKTAKAPANAQVNPPAVGATPAPATTARPRQDLLRQEGEDDVNATARREYYPDDPAVISPPIHIPSAVDDDEYALFFHGTPYATAPIEVQFDIIRKAQTMLTRMGFYRGAINGLPATLTSDALFQYQYQRRLSRTGRLDLQTLAELNLLPGRGQAPAVRGFTDPNRRRDRSVDYRGLFR